MHIDGILQKGPYLPCVNMAARAHLSGYHRYSLMRRQLDRTRRIKHGFVLVSVIF